jgi:hypothetical protein
MRWADLYVRAGITDKGRRRIQLDRPEHMGGEGLLPKAAALYKRYLKNQAGRREALWHLGNIFRAPGARSWPPRLFVFSIRKLATGGGPAATSGERAEVRIRLGDLDGADLDIPH